MDLVFRKGSQTLLHLRVERPEVCIGSHGTNDVVVPDPSVPEVAALLVDRGANRFRLRDLTGGQVQVNGRPLDGDEHEVAEGDAITLGPYQLVLQAEDAGRKRFGQTRVLTERSGGQGVAVLDLDGRRFQLDPNRPFNIGGHDDNDLQIRDPFASSFHCRLLFRDGRWFLADLESTNGTTVNGLRVKEAELPVPATIKLGQVVLQFNVELPNQPHDGTPVVFHGMVAASEPMRRVFATIQRFAAAKEPVLIQGASGSGKELVARAIHDESTRAPAPYLALNCGAFTAGLIESELFGHNRGAFTGAVADKIGAFEATQGGTLFLDEIGELPLELQPKLLRVLESQVVRRVGGTKEIRVDTRVIAATHRDLEELVRQGRFRADLFHRLFVLTMRIPPLSERPDDIVPLARHFLSSQAPEALELLPDAEAELLDYTWPGNVRELRNVMVRTILMRTGPRIGAEELRFARDAFTSRSQDARQAVRNLDETDRQELLDALKQSKGNRAEAARMLGLSKSTFHDRLKRLGIPLKKDGKDNDRDEG